MVRGNKYVVFVLAEFMNNYKKNLNNYNDYLSAPSLTFGLPNPCSTPWHSDDNIIVKDNVLRFSLRESPSYKVDYRCMFLPVTTSLSKGLLSGQSLRTIEGEAARAERIPTEYAP